MSAYNWKRERGTGPRRYTLIHDRDAIQWRIGVLREIGQDVWVVHGPVSSFPAGWEPLATLELPLRDAKQAAKLILTAKG